jgi:hypothetical protein
VTEWGAPSSGPPLYAPPPTGPPLYAPPPSGLAPYGAPTYGAVPYGSVLPAYPPAGRSGLSGWAIGLIVGSAVVLIVAVLTAIAIPVFLDQRSRAAELQATSITLPPTVAGMSEVQDPAVQDQIVAELAQMPCGCAEPPIMTLYEDGAGTHRLVVMAGRMAAPVREQQAQAAYSDDIWRGIRDGAATMSFGPVTAVEPGRLGGSVTCAPIDSGSVPGRACVAVDETSFVTMMEFAPVAPTDPTLPTVVREAVVHRG